MVRRTSILACVLFIGCGGKSLDLGDDQNSPAHRPETEPGPPPKTKPTAVVKDLPAGQLAAKGSRIFWSTFDPQGKRRGQVKSCEPNDCRHTVITYSDNAVGMFVVGEGDIYFTPVDGTPSYQTIAFFSCPLEGCNGAPKAWDVSPSTIVRQLFWDSDFFYFVPDDGSVQRCPASGCSGFPDVLAAVGDSSIFLDGSTLYVSAQSRVPGTGPFKFKMPKGGGPFEPLPETFPWPAAQDEGHFYFVDNANRTVSSCSKPDCADPVVLATTVGTPDHLVVDESNIYWMDRFPIFGSRAYNSIMECPLTGCGSTPKELARDQPTENNSLVVDDRYVYWTNDDYYQGTSLIDSIYRIEK
jgi:hypothetical protein